MVDDEVQIQSYQVLHQALLRHFSAQGGTVERASATQLRILLEGLSFEIHLKGEELSLSTTFLEKQMLSHAIVKKLAQLSLASIGRLPAGLAYDEKHQCFIIVQFLKIAKTEEVLEALDEFSKQAFAWHTIVISWMDDKTESRLQNTEAQSNRGWKRL